MIVILVMKEWDGVNFVTVFYTDQQVIYVPDKVSHQSLKADQDIKGTLQEYMGQIASDATRSCHRPSTMV